MAKYEDREMAGVALKNRDKQPGTRAPDYTGTLLVAGMPMRIALWEKSSERAGTYFSFQLSEPREKPPERERTEDRDTWD